MHNVKMKMFRYTGIAALVLLVCGMAACNSGPRVNKDGYFEPDVIRTDSHNGHIGYVDEANVRHGITVAPDGTDSYFAENAKTKIQDNFTLGNYEIITWLNPTNLRGYTRYEFELAFDNAQLAEDIETFYFKLQNLTDFYQWDCTADWLAVKQGFIDNPTVFQTVSVHYPGPPPITYGSDNPLRDATIIFHRFMTASTESLPGKIYIRGNRFYP